MKEFADNPLDYGNMSQLANNIIEFSCYIVDGLKVVLQKIFQTHAWKGIDTSI
jgi:hypothetical protein